MSIFKCKTCGGDLEVAEGVTIAECEYCGTKQTVPKAMDENLQNLFNRANTLRIKSEFDKAEKLYEKIIQADTTQSEAYWGLILCKYGIEYVDDPATFKKIPTCHRASYDSIIADVDYKAAIENADMSQRLLYEEQAKEIDRIQKEFLALAQKEENYDIFICYKETDADGHRTPDSVIANDIYYQLTQEGFKVFYAAITLEGKIGSAYEPIIFAALNSAKVMLSIGTKPEYFHAVWVKNEWSRFLKIVRNDRSKLLIPCYRDMDAYELPEEFAHLQAQDMAKIGFINDLVRGIKKVVKKDEPKAATVVTETVVTSTNTNVAPLLKRAFIFLDEGNWKSADEYCERVLDIDPENVQAYLGKLMAEFKVRKKENLQHCAEPFNNSNNYQRVLRFGDDSLKTLLTGYIEYIKTRNENARLEGIYDRAKKTMLEAKTEGAYKEAANLFRTIYEYKDSANLIKKCLEDAEAARKNAIFSEALSHMNKTDPPSWVIGNKIPDYEKAISLFKSIGGWKNSDEQILICRNKIEEIKAKEALAHRKAINRRIKNFTLKFIILPLSVIAIIALLIAGWFSTYAFGNYSLYVNWTKTTHFEIPDGVTEISSNKFENCDILESIVIPDSVTSIGDSAFSGCSNLTSVVIGDSVTSIGNGAFFGCSNLTKIVIPNSVMSIGDRAFSGCSNLIRIVIGDGLTSIDWRDQFYECNNLTNISFVEKNIVYKSVDGNVYSKDGKTLIQYAIGKKDNTFTIPDGVTNIGEWAFRYCDSLENVVIPDSVTSIGKWAFSNCSSLDSVVIPGNITSIAEGMFCNCTSLASITYKGTKNEWGKISKEAYWNHNTGNYVIYYTDGDIKE